MLCVRDIYVVCMSGRTICQCGRAERARESLRAETLATRWRAGGAVRAPPAHVRKLGVGCCPDAAPVPSWARAVARGGRVGGLGAVVSLGAGRDEHLGGGGALLCSVRGLDDRVSRASKRTEWPPVVLWF